MYPAFSGYTYFSWKQVSGCGCELQDCPDRTQDRGSESSRIAKDRRPGTPQRLDDQHRESLLRARREAIRPGLAAGRGRRALTDSRRRRMRDRTSAPYSGAA